MEQNRKPELYLITQEFPYGPIEDSFVKPEYPYLCKHFHVSVIAAELSVPEAADRSGIDACIIPAEQSVLEKLFSLFRFLGEKDCYREITAIVKSGQKIPQRVWRALMFGTAAETFYRRLKKKISMTKDMQALFYFYWFDYKCLGLTMHRRKYPGIQIVARTHGYELYDYRELYGRQFFKPQMDARLEQLIFAAQSAKDYYLRRYGRPDGEKYPLHRLGVPYKGVTAEDRKSGCKEEFLLLSCANVVPLKRIELIIDGLSHMGQEKVKWVHIGAGEQLERMRELAAVQLDGRKNISYEFTGALPNDMVVDYYKKQYVSCFITTTETEGGSPVAVQEALSFGVPVIATAVGELVQMVQDNGFLLPENPIREEVAGAIGQMVSDYGSEAYFRMCSRSLEIFEEKFDAQRNFSTLAEELKKLWSNTR